MKQIGSEINMMKKLLESMQGSAMVEMALVVCLLALLALPAAGFLGKNIEERFSKVAVVVETGSGCGGGESGSSFTPPPETVRTADY